jgi:MtN3 and saliva related transmembrane protein
MRRAGEGAQGMTTELIGWISSLILLLTLGRQVYTQWRSEATSGVSKWLFVGQLTASAGFAIYSLLLKNWVFFVTNIALLITACVGEAIYLRNRRRRKIPAPLRLARRFLERYAPRVLK